MRDRRSFLTVLSGGIPPTNPAYIAKMLSYNPVAFWPLVKDGLDVSGNGHHATPSAGIAFQGGTGRDGRASAYFNDASFVDLYSAGLAGAFSGDEIVFGGWVRQTVAALTDADTHDFPVFYSNTANTLMFMRSTNGHLNCNRTVEGVAQNWNPIAAGNFGSAWKHVLMRVSIANNNIACILNGVVSGSFAASVNWVGTCRVDGTLLGASAGAAGSKIHHWLGWMQYVGIWPYLNNTQCADLAAML